MSECLVSIVVPVYNSEKTVGKCLDSLINQTYRNIEIICVNDCSKDKSLELLKEYASRDSRIVVIDHKENMNAGGTRNTGIKAANGHYVCFVDNDDWLTNEAIEMLVDASDYYDADLVASDWITYYSEMKQVINCNLKPAMNHEEIIAYICHHGFRMLGCLWKRSLFIDNNLFFPEKVFYEDNAVVTTMVCYAKKVNYVAKPLYYYAMLPTSVTGFVTQRKITDRITTTEMYIENLKKSGFYQDRKSILDFYCLQLCSGTLSMLSCFPWKKIKEDFYRNYKLINSCKPNEYVDSLSLKLQVYIKYPVVSYVIMRIIKPIKPYLVKYVR